MMKKTIAVAIIVAGVMGFSASLFAKPVSFVKAKKLKKVAVIQPSYKRSVKKYKATPRVKTLKKKVKKRRVRVKTQKKVNRIAQAKKSGLSKNWDKIDFYLLKMGHQENGGDIFK